MQSNFAKVAIVVVAAAAAITLFIVLGDDDSDESASDTTQTIARDAHPDDGKKPRGAGIEDATEEIPRITVVEGKPAGGIQELEFTAGDEVRFEVDSDTAQHVHVHGYDVIQDVEPGKPVEFAFPADIEGIFEVELEDSATQIAELTVNPK